MNDEQRMRIAEYADAIDTWPSSKPRKQRSMRVGQRSRKQQKQWRTTQQERRVLRYTTESEW